MFRIVAAVCAVVMLLAGLAGSAAACPLPEAPASVELRVELRAARLVRRLEARRVMREIRREQRLERTAARAALAMPRVVVPRVRVIVE
jgi:hypothetical protein